MDIHPILLLERKMPRELYLQKYVFDISYRLYRLYYIVYIVYITYSKESSPGIGIIYSVFGGTLPFRVPLPRNRDGTEQNLEFSQNTEQIFKIFVELGTGTEHNEKNCLTLDNKLFSKTVVCPLSFHFRPEKVET